MIVVNDFIYDVLCGWTVMALGVFLGVLTILNWKKNANYKVIMAKQLAAGIIILIKTRFIPYEFERGIHTDFDYVFIGCCVLVMILNAIESADTATTRNRTRR